MKALFLPADGTEGTEAKTLYLVEGGDYMAIAKRVGIEWIERVHGTNTRNIGFVAAVDGDGQDKNFKNNPLAAMAIGYPGRIAGPALFFCEEFDDDGGLDFISISSIAEDWLKDFLQMPIAELSAPVKAKVEVSNHPKPGLKVIPFETVEFLQDFLEGH